MDEIIKIASQYGAMGLGLLACFWYINKKDEASKTEREKMTETLETMHKDALTTINNNTNILSELASLIKNK